MNLNQTPNYALPSWEATDRILMEDFNDMTEKLDEALKSHDDALAGKAAQSAVSALTQTVNGLADQVGLKGNCRIYYTTYTGTGEAGPSHRNSLTLPEPPLLVLVVSAQGEAMFLTSGMSRTVYHAGGGDVQQINVSWSGNTAYWWLDNEYYPYEQMNNIGSRYHVVALYQMD